jgi:predicted MFS family arabinose efflux permease
MEGLRWWWRRQRLDSAFLLFSLSSGVFYFGEFVFFLLYNLYLVQCGFHEQAIGQIAAAVTFGTFAGALPATAFTRSFGLGKGLLMAIAGTATSGVLRIFLLSPLALDISAFFNGVSMAFWVVSVPPVVAGITNVKNRTLAFSIITAVGIGVGALAGVVGGTLPGLLQKLNPTATVLQINRVTLLAGCTLLTLALVPVSRLRIKTASPDIDNNRTYPRSRFAMTFLATLFIWSVGTGGFNPFFNVYFSRYQQDSVKSLGLIFSVSQSSQVIAILILPVVIKGMGQVKSVAALQTITGMLLGLLALIKAPFVAAGIYVAYMSFQYASEPYLLSLLMSGVQISERKGASALYFMVTSLAGIIAAWVAGATLERLGYKPTMLACAAITLIAAGLYYRAFRCRALFAPDFNGQTSVLE